MNTTYTYTGKPIVPPIVLKLGDKMLEEGVDFDVEVTDNINAGTAHVSIIGKGKYSGTNEQTFKIEPVAAKSLSFFADSTEFDYNGEPQKMHIEVKFGDVVLTEGVDYVVEYRDNIEPGKATARLTFSGNFVGIMNIPFTIKRSFINDSFLSADTVNYTDKAVIHAVAKGGIEPYQYSYYIKNKAASKWTISTEYTTEAEYEYAPFLITDYDIVVRIKDASGIYTEKQLALKVVPTLNMETMLSSKELALSETLHIAAQVNAEGVKYQYYVKKSNDKKWTLITKGVDITTATYTPKESGTYKLCVKADTPTGHTKEYIVFRVK